jgi:hypothetical protein
MEIVFNLNLLKNDNKFSMNLLILGNAGSRHADENQGEMKNNKQAAGVMNVITPAV